MATFTGRDTFFDTASVIITLIYLGKVLETLARGRASSAIKALMKLGAKSAHVERNGHHYVHGFGGQEASAIEQTAFLAAHPDLYASDGAGVRLRIESGALTLGSLNIPGFASGAYPQWASLRPLAESQAGTTVLFGVQFSDHP